MLIPSIDLRNGHAVQLVGGKEQVLDAGPPEPIADRFGRVGEIAVIDLDAAMGTGDNQPVIERLLKRARCRVGGGIRTPERAIDWLDRGAEKVILGTAARPEVLRQLPKDRVMAALDAIDGEVVVDGWKTRTGRRIEEQIEKLAPWVGGFLVTFVESEGRLSGIDMDRVRGVVDKAGSTRVTVAGGVTTVEDIRAIHELGADAQVGMALYTDRIHVADGFAAPLTSDRTDGLFPTVVTDPSERVLGLVYSSQESLREAVDTGRGVYYSRSRKTLWRKGESSGATQRLLRVDLDCDADALRFVVEQEPPGFCHLERASCFGPARGFAMLAETLDERLHEAPKGSYTARLFGDPALLASKLREEAKELADAEEPEHIAEEAADLLYFAMVKLAKHELAMADVERILDRRARKLKRRPGDAKPDNGGDHG